MADSGKRIIIAGLGSSGYAAMMAAKRRDPSAKITVIDPKDHDLMHPCGLPYAMEGFIDPASLYQDLHLQKMGVAKIKGRTVGIDGEKNQVRVLSGNGEIKVPYDSLIISSGSRPLLPPIDGIKKLIHRGLYTLTTVDDLNALTAALKNAKKALVIGAGAIGLEAAMALRHSVPDVTVVEMREQVLPGILDEDMAAAVKEYLAAGGISLNTGMTVSAVHGAEVFTGIGCGDRVLSADLGIMAAGFIPDVEFLSDSGIEVQKHGIVVDEYLRTSLDGVYAAGDCIAAWSVIDGRQFPAKLATGAYKQGIIAGTNAAGGNDKYRGTAGTFVTRIGRLEVSGTGYTRAEAARGGYDPVEGKIKTGILPEYFPGNPGITVKLIGDRKTGKIIGAQALGERGAAERINIISTVIECGLKPEEIAAVELAYCPAVSEVVDPLHKALDFLMRRMRR